MFETTGIMDRKILKELGKYIIPDIQRLPIKVIAVVSLIWGIISILLEDFQQAALLIASSVLFFLFALCLDAIMKRHYIKWNIRMISEYTDPNKCAFTTVFDADGVHVTNDATGGTGAFPYTQIKKVVETKNCYFLWTKRQFTVTFKAGLSTSEKEQFIPYIKEQCPKIKVIHKSKSLFRWTSMISNPSQMKNCHNEGRS